MLLNEAFSRTFSSLGLVHCCKAKTDPSAHPRELKEKTTASYAK